MAAKKNDQIQNFVPVKTYTVVNPSKWRIHRLELRYNNQAIMWIADGGRNPFSSAPNFTVHTQSFDGPIVAAGKHPSCRHDIRIRTGNPQTSAEAAWVELRPRHSRSEYTFTAPNGRAYAWRRRSKHDDNALGMAADGDFQLLALTHGAAADAHRSLAVFIRARKSFGRADAQQGRIVWMVEFAPDLELFLLTAVLMIAARVRAVREQQSQQSQQILQAATLASTSGGAHAAGAHGGHHACGAHAGGA